MSAEEYLRLVSITVGLTLLTSGCLASSPTLSITPVPTQIELFPSATFAFPTIPPTSTHIPTPRLTPTANPLSALGDVIFEDDFNQDRGWELVSEQAGAISLANDRLVIAIRQSKIFLFTLLPDLILDNFFFEVEVRSDLCQTGDEFGVLFRANDRLEHYRFSLTCEGESRVVRVLSGDSRSLVPLTNFPHVRSGPTSSNHLSLIAVDDTFQFWINGIEAFSIRDTALSEGKIGLFVRSGRENQATISFDNLVLRELLTGIDTQGTSFPE